MGAPPPVAYGFGPCPGCAKYHACDFEDRLDEGNGRNGYHPYHKENDLLVDWAWAGIIQLGRVTTKTGWTPKRCET